MSDIYYEVHGEGDPVIFISGLGGDHTAWHWQISEYSKIFKCIVFDNRGIGRSKTSKENLTREKYTLEVLASDVALLMDQLGIDKAHISGASMGGIIAQQFAVTYTDRLKTLSLHSTLGKSATLLSLNFRSQINLLEKISVEELLFSLAPQIWSEETLENRADLIAEFRNLKKDSGSPASKEVYILQAAACLDFNLLPGLSAVKVPVLVTAGAEDILIHPRNSEAIHKAVPGSEYVVFQGCGHGPMMEKYKEFNSVAINFLKKNRS